MDGELTFDTNSLQTYDPVTDRGIITSSIEHTSQPEKRIDLLTKADADGSVIPAINYSQKRVTISGTLKGADQYVSEVLAVTAQEDLDVLIDTFKGYFNGKNKHLDITYGVGTRRYIATANSISITRQQRSPFAKFAIEFVCTNPFGLDTTPTTFINDAGRTVASDTYDPTITGSAPLQLPIFTITINSLTGTGDYIQVANDLNGQMMLLYGVGFANGDVLVIDSSNRTVTLNDIEIDYEGTFLELEPGANSITISDGFTTRNIDIEAELYVRWL